MRFFLVLMVVLSTLFSGVDDDGIVELRLNGLVKEVIYKNGDAIKEYLALAIAKEQVEYEKGIYDPLITSNLMRQSTYVSNSVENELVRFQETYDERVDYFDTKVSGLFSTGTLWSFIVSHNKKQSSLITQNKDYSTEYESSLKIELEQPLLRNNGKEVTEAKIALSKYEKELKSNQFKQKLMELQGATIQLYWRLYGAKEIYKSWEESIKLAQKEYDIMQQKVKSGKVAHTELLEAKSILNIKKSEYENAKGRYDEVKYQLLTLLNVPFTKANDYEIITDKKVEQDILSLNTTKDYVDSALAFWPEYQSAKVDIQKADLQLKYSQNQALPEFNVLTSVEKNTLDSNRNDAITSTLSNPYSSWYVGFKFSTPIFNDQAKSSVRIAKLKLREAKESLSTLENNLLNSIMTKINSVKSSKKQYEYYKDSLQIKKDLMQIEHNKLVSGKSSINDVFSKEEEYMNYQRKYLSSIINWKTSEALLDISTGKLLSKYNIDINQLQYDIN